MDLLLSKERREGLIMSEETITQTEARYLKDFLQSVIQNGKTDEKAFTQPLEVEKQPLIDTFSEETANVPMKGQCTNSILDGKFEGIQGVPINCNMILTGLPSSGKSLLCMQLALNLASSGVRVCYVTSEEIFKSEAGRYSLEARMYEKAKLLEHTIMSNIKKNLFIIDTVKNAELREWVNFVGEYRRLVDNQRIEFLIVDSITMLEDNRTQMKNRLLDLARFNQTHGVTSIMINQRAVEEADNMAMAGGIALSHIVDIVMVMDYKKISSWDGTLKLDIPTAKQGQELKFFRILKCRLCKFDARYFAYEITKDGLIKEIKNEASIQA
jgi:KaiC/GvpD/RAD55 family RecA-like ATPase